MSQPTCQVCNLTLPTATTSELCDDCQDGITHIPQHTSERLMRVVHNGLISKRNGGLEEMTHG